MRSGVEHQQRIYTAVLGHNIVDVDDAVARRLHPLYHTECQAAAAPCIRCQRYRVIVPLATLAHRQGVDRNETVVVVEARDGVAHAYLQYGVRKIGTQTQVHFQAAYVGRHLWPYCQTPMVGHAILSAAYHKRLYAAFPGCGGHLRKQACIVEVFGHVPTGRQGVGLQVVKTLHQRSRH